MSKSRSEEKYQQLRASYQKQARALEKELHEDLSSVRHEYVPHHLKRKFLTGLGIFGTVYLAEKLLFGKKIPRIVRFTTSLSAIVLAPKIYRLIEDKILSIGELDPMELEMLEDQQLDEAAVGKKAPSKSVDDTVTPLPTTEPFTEEQTSEQQAFSENPEGDIPSEPDIDTESSSNQPGRSEEDKDQDDPHKP